MAARVMDQVRRIVGRMLVAEGFERKSVRFVRRTEAGDFGIVEFQRSSWLLAAPAARFYVNLAVCPGPVWEWFCHVSPGLRERRGGVPNSADNVWHYRLRTPQEMEEAWGGIGNGWLVGEAWPVARVAELIETELRTVALPRMERMLRRDVLMSFTSPLGPALPAALLAERGPSEELSALLDEQFAVDTDRRPVSTKFAAWARSYANRDLP